MTTKTLQEVKKRLEGHANIFETAHLSVRDKNNALLKLIDELNDGLDGEDETSLSYRVKSRLLP